MFYFFIYLLNIINSTLFSLMNHPLAMGLILLIQTILICFLMGLMTKTFWFSYILFIVFIGGMLVLFIYVTSLASNEMFSFSSNLFMLNLLFMIFFMIFYWILDKSIFMNYFKNLENNFLINQKSFLKENCIILNKLYNFPINISTIMLMIYLFITLIAIVKITNIFEGPLRPKF